MFAVVEIANIQFKVQPNEKVKVPRLPAALGETVKFTEILMASDNDNIKIGSPKIAGKVEAKILEHGKDAKVIVFKKKRRKGYRKLNKHRQQYSLIEITNINVDGFEAFEQAAEPVVATTTVFEDAADTKKLVFDDEEIDGSDAVVTEEINE